MQARFAHSACLGFFLAAAAATSVAPAGELADFNAAVEKAAAYQRVAIGYLRTGNIDLAAREIEGMKTAWSAVVDRFAEKRPDVFDGNELYGATLLDVSTRIVAATVVLNIGRPDAARDALLATRSALSSMRRASGLYLLPDCILDANAAMDALFVFRNSPPDWARSEIRFDVAARVATYGEALKRCDRMAPAEVRTHAQFRRLIDGALASLALMPRVVADRDGELLHRILIELRSFDHLLAFHYG